MTADLFFLSSCSLFQYCSAVGKAYFWAGFLQYVTICMRARGEKEKKKETQKQVLTSNQICCIDFATSALEQIRETATLSLRIRSSLERAGSKGAHPDTQRGTSACTHTHAGGRTRLCGCISPNRALRWEALITEAAEATRSPFLIWWEFQSKQPD